MSRPPNLTSFHLLFNFTVDQMKGWYVDIISLFNNKLLVGHSVHLSQLFVISRDGLYLSTVTIIDNDRPYDATWTIRGKIIYSMYNIDTIVLTSESGEVITTHNQIEGKSSFALCSDGIIYLYTIKHLYHSIDDGVNWSKIFKLTDAFYKHVVKVINEYSDDFWTIVMLENADLQMRVYSVERTRVNDNVKWKNVNITVIDCEFINMEISSRMSYVDDMTIFLGDYFNKKIHVLLLNGQSRHCQLLSSHYIKINPRRLIIDRERQLMYVGQEESRVGVFKWTYGSSGD